jgi:phage terminase large subunit
MAIILTTAIKKIRRIKARKKIIQGGTSAGKTFGILPILIQLATKNAGLEISVISESFPHLRRGVIKDFIKIMQDLKRFVPEHYNITNAKYTFSNGSFIEFFSVDQEHRVRGARRHILYVNEANNIKWETYYQLAIRTSSYIFLDFNPTAEFWAHTEVLKDDDAELIILTYEDNEGLNKTTRAEIEKAREKAKTSPYWQNWWNVYGLGLIGNLQGVIFNNWSQIPKIPTDAKYLGSGMDFGYTNDPSVLIDVWELDGEYIFDEVVFTTGLNNNQLAKLCGDIVLPSKANDKEQKIRRRIYADSAEPKSIDEIAGHGIAIYGARKGADSVKYGIQLLQGRPFRVTARSLNIIKELRNYLWAVDRAGQATNSPIEIWNHGIDAMRYWAIESISVNRKIDIR